MMAMVQVVLVSLLTCMPSAEKVTAILDFRGLSVREAFEKLRNALPAHISIASEVPAELLGREVRLYAEHLSPDQSVRWIARLAGLEAVRTDSGYFVATPDHLDRLGMRPHGVESILIASTSGRAEDRCLLRLDAHQRTLLAGQGAVFWEDAPLTHVSADISRVFGMDMILHPELLAQEGLVAWEKPAATLREVCVCVADQLHASVVVQDGAIWVRPVEPADGERLRESKTLPVDGSHGGTLRVRSEPTSRPAAGGFAAESAGTWPSESASSPNSLGGLVETRRGGDSPAARPVAPASPSSRREPPKVIYRADSSGGFESLAGTRSAPAASHGPPAFPGAARLTVDSSIRDWSAFARHVELATGAPCHLRDFGAGINAWRSTGR